MAVRVSAPVTVEWDTAEELVRLLEDIALNSLLSNLAVNEIAKQLTVDLYDPDGVS